MRLGKGGVIEGRILKADGTPLKNQWFQLRPSGEVEAKYKDLEEYLDDADDPGGLTLGQHFLEKIIQINFRIPRADPKVVESFIDANLDALEGEPPPRPSKEERTEAEQLIEAEQRAGKSLDEAVQAVHRMLPSALSSVPTRSPRFPRPDDRRCRALQVSPKHALQQLPFATASGLFLCPSNVRRRVDVPCFTSETLSL